ncbi:hypothetical protein HYH02_015153 [Chlamydomonas schloesseri]|uniref:FAD-binding domain-containing protein n=1 Tax=Chlamydomonas schloesseri TaxID=2026947 RepID=A0A835SCD2_9CHLO|nr:hypothetical protein HYH02_015153 [Chlamydomonas schloesseri]|eukprot:KAG2424673.1 hypothetical protein HYH02_015153 [Chlamydomonas schloesseri]
MASGANGSSAPSAVTSHVDYAIIGGGPSGLLTAKALLKAVPGASVQVYETARGYWPQGAGVLIELNGWRALHAVDDALADKLRSQGFLFGSTSVYDETGNPMKLPYTQSMDWNHAESERVHGHTRVMVYWGDIRQALFESLPEGMVSFNSRITAVTPGEPGGQPAVLQMQDATGGTRTVTAGLVVAADGFYSRTKRLVWGGGMPAFTNRLIWRALVQYERDEEVPELLRRSGGDPVMWMGQGVPPSRFATVYTVGHNRFVWTCIAGTSYLEQAGLSWSPAKNEDVGIQQAGAGASSPAKARCLAVFERDYPPALVDLLRRTDPALITEHGAYLHDLSALQGAPDWVRGNVVLVGDAAHTAPPDGQGLNMALEDVAVLGACLQESGPTHKALEDYAAARLPRVRDVWVRPPGAFEPPNRLAALLNASFTPLGAGPHSGKSRPLPGWQPAQRVEVQPTPAAEVQQQVPQQVPQQVQQKA